MKKYSGAVVPDIVFIICDSFLKCKRLYEKLIITRKNVTKLKQILDKPHPERDGFRAKSVYFRPKSEREAGRGGGKAERREILVPRAGCKAKRLYKACRNLPFFAGRRQVRAGQGGGVRRGTRRKCRLFAGTVKLPIAFCRRIGYNIDTKWNRDVFYIQG